MVEFVELVNEVKLFDVGYVFIVFEDGIMIVYLKKEFNGKFMLEFLGESKINVDIY